MKKKAKKNLKKIDHRWTQRIYQELVNIRNNPYNTKHLKGDRKGEYVVRVWPYRIIYEIHDDVLVVLVIDITHRQQTY